MLLDSYYNIWIEAIVLARKKPENKSNWKLMTMLFMSMAMALNLLLALVLLQHFLLHKMIYNIHVDVFPGEKLDDAISFFMLFLLPCVLVNYFLIMHNNRYEWLFEKYGNQQHGLFVPYFLVSLFLPLVLLIFLKLVS
jgi:hypothetical protein